MFDTLLHNPYIMVKAKKINAFFVFLEVQLCEDLVTNLALSVYHTVGPLMMLLTKLG